MKKISCPALLLCLALLLQLFSVPALATEPESSVPATEPEIVSPVATVPTVAYGTASITNGCRTLEGQMPLGGSDRILSSAQAAFVYEMNTGTVIYSYNPDTTLNPGALVKIMTAIVALENGKLDDRVTVSTANHGRLPAGAINSALKHDEVLSLEDLLNCMILELSNDAALAIAEHIAKSETAFVELMNEKAQEIGCTGTVFANCHGVSSSGQSTTSRDMAKIVNYALKNSDFRTLFSTTDYTVPATNKMEKRNLESLNYLFQQTVVPKYTYDKVNGGMGVYGSTYGASLACTAEYKGLSLLIIVLGATRTFTDTGIVSSYGNFEEAWTLLDFGFDNYKICELIHDGQSMNQFPVAGGINDVVGQTATSMDVVLPANAKLDNLILKYNVTGGGLTAPVRSGQLIATLQLWYRSSCVAETELYAMSSVNALEDSDLKIQSASKDDTDTSEILSFLGVVCLIVLVPLVGYLVVNNVRRVIARNRRRRMRQMRRRRRRV